MNGLLSMIGMQTELDYLMGDLVSKNGKFILMYSSVEVIQYGDDGETIFEHLGFFYQLNRQLSKPYNLLLEAFITHFKDSIGNQTPVKSTKSK
jgi:hypothetical protein